MKTVIMAFAVVQVALYLFFAFIAWDFWWFFWLADWSQHDRASILIIWVFASAALILPFMAINEGLK